MSIDFNKCAYMNGELQNASVMLRKCINGSDELAWPCVAREEIDKEMYSTFIERPNGDNIQEKLVYSLDINSDNQKKDNIPETDTIEGFTNMGEKYVRPGDCPDGYNRCLKTGKCIQVCMNCKYNQRTYGKSKEFNEFDKCFPNKGVYDGINNDGYTQCSCGSRNQYCGDNFNAQGGLYNDNVFIMNVGDFSSLGKLAAY